MKYPMVTDVGSELGRPDDGTDPTGFFNDEFYVGLKPYTDVAWKTGSLHNKVELQANIERQLDAFPGVIFTLRSRRRRCGRSVDGTQKRAGGKGIRARP